MSKRKEIPELSRLSINNLENYFEVNTDEDGRYHYDLTDTVYIDTENMNPLYYNEHEIQENDTLHVLAVKYYGNYKLWWVIASSNGLDNPFELTKGDTIKILNRDALGRILSLVSGNDN